MPVLEVTQLPVRAKLHTGSQFYNCTDDPALIYILGIWPSLEAHVEFLASPSRDDILGPQEGLLQFGWTVHVDMGGMSSLPLDAPILAIERIRVSEECTQAFDQAAERHAQELRGSHPFKVAYGWRCDAGPKNQEALIFSGWQIAQAHVNFPVQGSEKGRYEVVQTTYARNLEH
ncbi:uncharacterized protein yc1106_03853 [Curvularia clavata]|uniref:Uncharacterized protein n=1 Tax=Curvularia clavata TaxID=95742 RepID=A0A9Q8Z800_CURCL|nr:uncharacterized protein yc1106_03853 [Curvularia clavata]